MDNEHRRRFSHVCLKTFTQIIEQYDSSKNRQQDVHISATQRSVCSSLSPEFWSHTLHIYLFYMHILGSSVIQADELSFYKFYTFLTSLDMEQLVTTYW